MNTFLEHFRDGGWGMFPTVLFGLLMLGVAVRYAINPQRRLVPLLLGLGVLTLTCGGLGFVSGVITTFHFVAISDIPGDKQGAIAMQGVSESLNNVAFALSFLTLAAASACYGAWTLARRVEPSPPVHDRA
jgi:hypothetical protein